MVYRVSPGDRRVAELEALVATEPAALEERTRVRIEHDAACEQADRAAVELAEVEQGVLARLGARKDKIDISREDHRVLAERVEALALRERELAASLAAIAAAREELATLESQAAAALATAEGPVGDELRALDAATAQATAAITALEPALRAGERAQAAMASVGEHVGDLRVATSAVRTLGQLIVDGAAVLGGNSPEMQPLDRTIVRERLQLSLGYARDMITQLLTELAAARLDWVARMPERRLRELAAAPTLDPAETSLLARNAAAVTSSVDENVTAIARARDALVERRTGLAEQRRQLVARVVRGGQ